MRKCNYLSIFPAVFDFLSYVSKTALLETDLYVALCRLPLGKRSVNVMEKILYFRDRKFQISKIVCYNLYHRQRWQLISVNHF